MKEKRDKFESWIMGNAENWLESLTVNELLSVSERVDNLREYIDERYWEVLGELGERTKKELVAVRTAQNKS